MYGLMKLTRSLPRAGGLNDQSPYVLKVWRIVSSIYSEYRQKEQERAEAEMRQKSRTNKLRRR